MMVGDDLWISSITNGIYVVDTKAMKMLHRYRKTNQAERGGLISGITMCQQDGTIFVGSSTGVYTFDKEEESFIMMPEFTNTYAHHLYADQQTGKDLYQSVLWCVSKQFT